MDDATNSEPAKTKSPDQAIKDAVDKAALTAILQGDWMTDELMIRLVGEAQDMVMGRVLAGMAPDLRTLAAAHRDRLRDVVLRRFQNAVQTFL